MNIIEVLEDTWVMKIVRVFVSIIVGFFAFSIFKLIIPIIISISLRILFIGTSNTTITITNDNYEMLKISILIFSLYLTVKYVKYINAKESRKERNIFRIGTILFGFISALLIVTFKGMN